MAVTLAPSALTTLANLQELLGVTDNDDALIQTINRVSAWLDRETNRKLKARHYKHSETAFSGTSVISLDNPTLYVLP